VLLGGTGCVNTFTRQVETVSSDVIGAAVSSSITWQVLLSDSYYSTQPPRRRLMMAGPPLLRRYSQQDPFGVLTKTRSYDSLKHCHRRRVGDNERTRRQSAP
jgi:hypothetical protein